MCGLAQHSDLDACAPSVNQVAHVSQSGVFHNAGLG